MLTVRNLTDEVRAILEETALPEGRAALGTLLTAVGRRAGLMDGWSTSRVGGAVRVP